jgi:hypothetical protein
MLYSSSINDGLVPKGDHGMAKTCRVDPSPEMLAARANLLRSLAQNPDAMEALRAYAMESLRQCERSHAAARGHGFDVEEYFRGRRAVWQGVSLMLSPCTDEVQHD